MKKKKRFQKEKLRKGIYILPNIFTSLNLFCGFYSIVSSINGNYTAAAWSILIAGIFDLMDGKIARATNTTSKFGVEYDSLSDLISFGLAPGLMIYLWALKPMDILGRTAWLAAFLFLACGALRLARFNTHAGTASSEYFTGLPIPSAAGMNAAIVLICARLSLGGHALNMAILVMLYVLSFLMVSTVKYNSFKKAELFKKMNFNLLVVVILVIIFVAAEPEITLFAIGITYLLSGPVTTLRLHARKSSEKPKPSTSENNV
jgi:CDP-diacylglycerol--serine O-phosphatidyltransferase